VNDQTQSPVQAASPVPVPTPISPPASSVQTPAPSPAAEEDDEVPALPTQQSPQIRTPPVQPRQSSRVNKGVPPTRLNYEVAFFMTTESDELIQSLIAAPTQKEHNYRYIIALLTKTDTGLIDAWPVTLRGLKATAKSDPDSPTFQEAMNGPYREEYIKTMDEEIKALS